MPTAGRKHRAYVEPVIVAAVGPVVNCQVKAFAG